MVSNSMNRTREYRNSTRNMGYHTAYEYAYPSPFHCLFQYNWLLNLAGKPRPRKSNLLYSRHAKLSESRIVMICPSLLSSMGGIRERDRVRFHMVNGDLCLFRCCPVKYFILADSQQEHLFFLSTYICLYSRRDSICLFILA